MPKIASVSAYGDQKVVTTGAINTTGATLIVINVANYRGEAACTVTDSKGNTYVPLTPAADATVCRSRLYYCVSPVVGSGHIFTATVGAGISNYPSMQVLAWSGASTFIAEATGSASTSTASLQVGSALNPPAGSLFITGFAYYETTTISIDQSFIIDEQIPTVASVAVGGAIGHFEPAAGSKQPTWAWTNNINAAAVMATFTATGPPSDPRISQAATELISFVPPAINLMTNLVGHWPMNEAGALDTALDIHGSANLSMRDDGGGNAGQNPIEGTPARDFVFASTSALRSAADAITFTNDQAFTVIWRIKRGSTAWFTFFWLMGKTTDSVVSDYGIFWIFNGGSGAHNTSFSFNLTDSTGAGNTVSADSGVMATGDVVYLAFGYDPTADKMWIRINNNARVESTWTTGTRHSTGAKIVFGDTTPLVNAASLEGAGGPASLWKRSLSDAEVNWWIYNKGNYATFGGIDSRISQTATELISSFTSDPRISQIATELISLPPPNEPRISQVVAELISSSLSDPRISQLVIELLSLAPPNVPRISQIATELISSSVSTPRTSQLAVELISLTVNEPRVSQLAIELISLTINEPRISQLAVELISFVAIPPSVTERSEFFLLIS